MKKSSPLAFLGITTEEAVIYELLIEKGSLSPTELCSITKLYRPTVYACLKNLLDKDIVSIIPHGKRSKYVANSPKRLKELSENQEKVTQDEIIRLEEISPSKSDLPKIVVRQGRQAIRMIYEDVVQELKKGDIYYRYQSIDTGKWVPGLYITPKSRRIRDVKDLQRFVITNAENKDRKRSNSNRSIKVLPQKHDLFRHNVGQLMYNNKTVIIDYNKEVATIIESEAITEFQKALFKTLFRYL
jgi:DNA-binding MarR family transcriptional regulator